ncbi:DUF6438 domain-containing protein [Sphingomonas xinjiangensis]|uniref:DUF6438 domain-containing protein n=1 Tax=Sphingomonas xinjiangensis TaxID=643568 RepID=A0A840Y952_9SPHN|nr:DUF6438 domain-containing protein [Sphingomonas xinjiangensis]MBB5709867.1 hypothetical protein [Sphingomonas xinjiangensis]
MGRQWMAIGAAALALAGCASDGARPGGTPVAIEADSITLETAPCHGRCPVYAVVVRPDGTGVFEGKQYTAVTGERPFRLSREQYDAFAAKLEPYRPAQGEVRYEMGSANCGNAPTDMPSTEVHWTRAIGDSQTLHFYHGCRVENAALAQALRDAPGMLPIGEMIGARP